MMIVYDEDEAGDELSGSGGKIGTRWIKRRRGRACTKITGKRRRIADGCIAQMDTALYTMTGVSFPSLPIDRSPRPSDRD